MRHPPSNVDMEGRAALPAPAGVVSSPHRLVHPVVERSCDAIRIYFGYTERDATLYLEGLPAVYCESLWYMELITMGVMWASNNTDKVVGINIRRIKLIGTSI